MKLNISVCLKKQNFIQNFEVSLKSTLLLIMLWYITTTSTIKTTNNITSICSTNINAATCDFLCIFIGIVHISFVCSFLHAGEMVY